MGNVPRASPPWWAVTSAASASRMSCRTTPFLKNLDQASPYICLAFGSTSPRTRRRCSLPSGLCFLEEMASPLFNAQKQTSGWTSLIRGVSSSPLATITSSTWAILGAMEQCLEGQPLIGASSFDVIGSSSVFGKFGSFTYGAPVWCRGDARAPHRYPSACWMVQRLTSRSLASSRWLTPFDRSTWMYSRCRSVRLGCRPEKRPSAAPSP